MSIDIINLYLPIVFVWQITENLSETGETRPKVSIIFISFVNLLNVLDTLTVVFYRNLNAVSKADIIGIT